MGLLQLVTWNQLQPSYVMMIRLAGDDSAYIRVDSWEVQADDPGESQKHTLISHIETSHNEDTSETWVSSTNCLNGGFCVTGVMPFAKPAIDWVALSSAYFGSSCVQVHTWAGRCRLEWAQRQQCDIARIISGRNISIKRQEARLLNSWLAAVRVICPRYQQQRQQSI